MKIVVQRDASSPEFTVDLKTVGNSYQIRDAIKIALELDGYSDQTIAEVFNQMPDAKCQSEQ